MKDFKLDIPLQMLFALLRASLHNREFEANVFENVSEKDWMQCYKHSAMQGVMALAWDGVVKLPAKLQPPRSLKITWAMAVESYEAKYARYCRTISDLTDFYSQHGIKTVQIKGVGFSALYPNPARREGGDIDIYTCSADTSKMGDRQANELADKLMQQQGIEVDLHSYKHSNFFYKGIPIENHKMFLNVEHYKVAEEVDAILQEVLNPQETQLLGGEYTILTPSAQFNTLFISFHAAQHYGTGISLHHLCDWAVLVNRYGLLLPDNLKDKRFRNWMVALTQLANRYLGTSVPVEGEVEYLGELMQEIFYPKYEYKREPVKTKLGILIYKTKRLYHRSRLLNNVLYEPIWRVIWKSALQHIYHPETIFGTREKNGN